MSQLLRAEGDHHRRSAEFSYRLFDEAINWSQNLRLRT